MTTALIIDDVFPSGTRDAYAKVDVTNPTAAGVASVVSDQPSGKLGEFRLVGVPTPNHATYALYRGPSKDGPWVLENAAYVASNPPLGTGVTLLPAPSGDTTGVTDYAALNPFFAAAGQYQLQAGDYYINTSFTITGSDVQIRGTGRKSVLHNVSTGAAFIVGTSGVNQIFTSQVIAADIAQWATTLTLTSPDGASFAAGDIVWIFNNDNTAAEYAEIESIAGQVVTVTGHLRYAYTVAKATKLLRFNWVRGIKMENFRITGAVGSTNGYSLRATLGMEITGMYIDNAPGNAVNSFKSLGLRITRCTFQDNGFPGPTEHIQFNSGTGQAVIADNLLIRSSGRGMTLSNFSDGTTVKGNVILEPKNGQGIYFTASKGITISGNSIFGAGSDGISSDNGGGWGPTNCTSVANVSQACDGAGQSHHTLIDSVVSGNTAMGCGEDGFSFDQSSLRVAVVGNSVDSCGQKGPSFRGIYVLNTGTYINIVGNILRNMPAWGIFLDAASANCRIVGNICTGNGSGAINTSGAVGVYVDGNQGYDPDGQPGQIVTPTYSASITPNYNAGDWQTITVTNGTAFTINAPTNPPSSTQSRDLVMEILNSSGGVMGAVTWNAAFVLVGGVFTNPASTKKRFLRFRWNGAAWIEQSRAGADY